LVGTDIVTDSAWYWCDIVDRFLLEELAEPDWGKVPEAKREQVRTRWEASREEKLKPTRTKLWGPQIEWYSRQPQYDVTVIGAA
jgi:hypothetical protein